MKNVCEPLGLIITLKGKLESSVSGVSLGRNLKKRNVGLYNQSLILMTQRRDHRKRVVDLHQIFVWKGLQSNFQKEFGLHLWTHSALLLPSQGVVDQKDHTKRK